MCEFFGSRIEKEKENNNKNHQICQTNASIVNQVLHECNLQSVKTTLKKHQIRHLIIFLSSSILYCVVVCLIRTKQISARVVRMPRSRSIITRFQLSDRLFALPIHPRYHSLPAKRVQGTLTLWEDMGQKYNDDYIRKKERKKERKRNFTTKRERNQAAFRRH